MNRFLKIVFCLLLPYISLGQADSLKKLLAVATHDTTRCFLLNQLIESENNDSIWPTYNDRIGEIANRNLKELKPPGKLWELFMKYRAIVLGNRAYAANMRGETAKAIAYYEETIAIQKTIDDKDDLAIATFNLADAYGQQGDVYKSLELFHYSLKLHEELKNDLGTSYVLNGMGWQYHVQGDDVQAMQFLEKARAIREKLNDKRSLNSSYTNLGIVAMEKGDLKKALAYFEKNLRLMEEIQEPRFIAMTMNSLGAVYERMGELKTSLNYYQKASEALLRLNDSTDWVTCNTNAAGVIFELSKGDRAKWKQAIVMTNKSLAAARRFGYPSEIRSAARTLHQIYSAMGDHKNALAAYDLFITMRDSITNEETKKASTKRQFQYEYEKKAAADSIKNKEAQKVADAQLSAQEAQLKQERTQRYVLIGGLSLVFVFFIFVFNRFRITRRQKVIIEEQKKRVDQAYESLHEKNKEVMDSIFYARRIQSALITSERSVQKQLERLRK